jgi:hypothetical protein
MESKTSRSTFFLTAFLTALILLTGCMLAFVWLFGAGRVRYDSTSVAIVFTGALVSRCLGACQRNAHEAA